ncbi:hypothetical protein TSAR_011373 [Trichomalopsis sarcophagae]|uniref:Uncharacterized protein n=1 Tax=Trichomalopsis sarcophagae TaxID=543379 RepID=A0A232EFY5_9HYME|nr:hypothetical protein TSAR_011373 [Trichomalopsis sarcophagae]
MPMVVNIDDLQPLNFDIDEYIDQLLNSQNTNKDQGNHKINQTRQLAKQLIREKIKMFEKYIEETSEEDPYGIKRLFQEQNEKFKTKILT